LIARSPLQRDLLTIDMIQPHDSQEKLPEHTQKAMEGRIVVAVLLRRATDQGLKTGFFMVFRVRGDLQQRRRKSAASDRRVHMVMAVPVFYNLRARKWRYAARNHMTRAVP
jgi:hypothetical protein